MTHSIIVPVMNQLHDTKGILGLLKNITSPDPEIIFIDNGSSDNYEEFIFKHLKPKKVQYIKNEFNIGVLQSMQQGYKLANSDIITYIHNDVYMYDQNWDRSIVNLMEADPKVGVIGAFGASGVGPDGGRIQEVRRGKAPGFSAMLEADVHGERISSMRYVSIMDGFVMSIRKELLDKTGGFDINTYKWHHFYDRDICLESIRHGYKNVVLGLSCHHWCGKTANQSEYQEQILKEYKDGEFEHTKKYHGDKATHDDNMKRFGDKWGEVLPIYVNSLNGDLLTENPYKGDSIIGYKLEDNDNEN